MAYDRFTSIPVDALGKQSVAVKHHITSVDWVYGMQTGDIVSVVDTAGSGTIASTITDLNILYTKCGTNSAGFAWARTYRYLHYNSGQAGEALASVIFPDAGVASNTRIIGIGNAICRLGFGYNGTALSVFHQTGARWVAPVGRSRFELDTTATAISGGIPIGTGNVINGGVFDKDFGNRGIIQVGDTITFATKVTSGAAYTSVATMQGVHR